MLRLIVAELAHRRGRALALLAGIAVATASFTVLTGASESSSLEVRGTVAQHFRTNYDLLVRPQGTMTPMERGGGLVQQNFLAGIDGGITMDQWHAMRRTPGVDVAAPLAVFGYVSPVAELPIALRPHLLPGPRTAFRLGVRWISDRGTLTLRDADSYAYVTRRGFDPEGYLQYRELTHATVFETVPGQASVPVCRGSHAAASAFSRAARSYLSCSSTQNGSVYGSSASEVRDVPARIQFPIPMIIAGVDPEAEARLSGTDRAVVSGRWLRSTDKPAIRGHGVQLLSAEIPVVAASAPQLDLEADVRLYRLSAAQAQGVRSAGPDRGRMLGALRSAAGERVGTLSFSASKAYNVFLEGLRTGAPLEARWTTGPLRYRARGPRHLAALPAKTDPYNWGSTWGLTGTGTGYVAAPPSAHDTGFRTLDQHVATNDGKVGLSSLRAVGTFDPRRVPGAGDRFRGALDPFRSAAAPLVDPSLLGGQTLAPDGNLAGYLTPPPTLLTTLDARSVLLSRQRWDDVQSQQAAPISVVRVRVEGVTGPDRTSRERIRLVAQRIARQTGLQVDVTAGSSPTPVRVDLPAGRDGRPALALREGWIKKGVAVAILTAVDRKSLILFGLVLVVCALFCLNAASAAVRTRSAELGVLACVGWPARRLFLYLLTEVGIVGLAAGVLGTLVALPVGALLGLPVSGSRALVAIPAATMLALLAGLVPAARAARSDPLEAVRPAVRAVRAARPARSVRALAIVNLLRVPGRTLLGALSLGVGVFALTLLLAVAVAFRGAVVGTVLGDAIAIEVRSADYVAVATTLVLGGLSVADVLYLNLRDRSSEIATLRATGWPERHLTRLIALEGAGLGALGGLGGALLGLGAAALFVGEITTTMPYIAASAAALGIVIATLASIAPAAGLRRLPTATLLAEE